jgi:predicted nucleic acid-binding protein
MTGKVFLDTNIILYAVIATPMVPLDRRTEISEAIISDGGAISVQVLNEFVDVVFSKHRKPWETIGQMLELIHSLCSPVVPLTAHTHAAAVEISKRYGFRIYDSLILAAADEAGCATVYTEDLQHGQVVGGVTIINPFL